MQNPNFVKIKEKKYKINTSYLVAIECDKIAKNTKIGDYERALAFLYTLYGDDGLECDEDCEKLIELGKRYLLLGEENKQLKTENNEPDFDYEQDMDLIKASFMYDYGIDLDKDPNMHWWTFARLLNGLSNSELGNCCILNRVRNLRNLDLATIKDIKTREKLAKAKEEVALIKKEGKEVEYTEEEKKSIDNFYKEIGMQRKEV